MTDTSGGTTKVALATGLWCSAKVGGPQDRTVMKGPTMRVNGPRISQGTLHGFLHRCPDGSSYAPAV